MDSIIAYFENIPTLHRAIIIVGGISFFWVLEGVAPLFYFNTKNGDMLYQIFFYLNNNNYEFFIGFFTFIHLRLGCEQ